MFRRDPRTTTIREFGVVLDWLASVDDTNPRDARITALVYCDPNHKEIRFDERKVFSTAAALFVYRLGTQMQGVRTKEGGYNLLSQLDLLRYEILAPGDSAFSDISFRYDDERFTLTILFQMRTWIRAYSVEFPLHMTEVAFHSVTEVAKINANRV